MLIVCGLGCAATTQPDDLSAEAHRRLAARERAAADEHAARFQPGVSGPLPGGAIGEPGVPGMALWSGPYNPTIGELREADRHLSHALAHEQAAAALEHFEAQECVAVPPRLRAACPLVPTATIEDLAEGVRLHMKNASAARDVVASMRCHLAYARARGFDAVPDCALYLPGVEIVERAEGIDVVSRRSGVAAEIRRRAHLELER
jgi:hypothetical protein